jgi:uncharacterized protein (DUF58 family)
MPVSDLLTPSAAARARRLEFFARTTVEGFMKGQNRSRLKGVSPEFMQYRMYMPRDDLRLLDWRILARTDRLVVREQQEFTNLDALVILDSSGSMGYRRGPLSKLDFARHCSAMLAYLLVQQNDRCGLALFGARLARYLPPGGGRKHLAELFRLLLEADPRGETDAAACAGQLLRQVSRRSVFLVFSDGFQDPEPLVRGLSMLALKGHEVLFFQTYDPSETDLDFVGFTQFLDLETQRVDAADPMEIRQAYREVFRTHQRRLRDGLLRAGIQFHPLPVCEAWETTLADIVRSRQP